MPGEDQGVPSRSALKGVAWGVNMWLECEGHISWLESTIMEGPGVATSAYGDHRPVSRRSPQSVVMAPYPLNISLPT